MPRILEIDPLNPQEARILRAVSVLQAGGIIAFPTETFYGLAADALNGGAVARVFAVKGRAFANPIALIAGDKNALGELVTGIPAAAPRLMQAFWPGPLTLLFPASTRIDARLTAGTGKIGIRLSSHPVAAALARHLGRPLTATSANLSGAPECATALAALAALGDRVDLVVDGGATPGGKGSTILDVTVDPPACLREGAITLGQIDAALEKNLQKA